MRLNMATQIETRLQIAACVNELMKKKPLEKISVVEVCKAADISRTTFYSYFQDVYAVSEWLWEYTIRNILTGIGTEYGWSEGHRRVYEFMLKNKNCFLHTESDRHRNSFLAPADENSLKIHAKNIETKLGRPLTDKELQLLSYISYIHASITHKWISDGMEVPPAEMQEMIADLLPPLIIDTLGK